MVRNIKCRGVCIFVVLCVLFALPVFSVSPRGTFSDVPANAWYAGYVADAYALGIINGKNANSYDPDGTLTLAECIKLASCIHQLRDKGVVTLRNGNGRWVNTYLKYALEEELIDIPYGDLDGTVTRGRVAEIFARVLGSSDAVINKRERYYTDVWDEDDRCYDAIYKLYRYGIMIGDDSGRFRPDDFISRAETAAVVMRMADETMRVRGEIALRRQVTCPILMYHNFDTVASDYTITPSIFRSHLDMFVREGYTTITFEELLRFQAGEDNLPLKPILLLSDDGYLGVLDYALPLLEEYDMCMSVAVIGSSVGIRGEGVLPHFTMEEESAADISNRIELVSHSYDLHKSTAAMDGAVNLTLTDGRYADVLSDDCAIMRDLWGDDHPMMNVVFVYPFGKYSEDSEALLRGNGYCITISTEKGVAVVSVGDPMEYLPRITAEWFHSGDALLKKLK